ADAIRWYFYTNSAPWLPNKFSDATVVEGQRKFMGTLWNTYAFFVLYANIDEFDATKYTLDYDKLPVMDKWLLSRLNTTIREVDNNLENYRIPEAGRALDDFVDEMSNWYVRRCRERFWAKGMEQDKINAYMTLYTALVTISKAAAPMIPFMTEDIYRNLVCSVDPSAPESIHLCDYPAYDESKIDTKLEKDMDEVLNIVVIGRACRNEANIKQRQPLAQMFVKASAELSEFYREIIEDELNVKTIEFRDDVSSFAKYIFKPNFKTLGKRFGGNINTVKQLLLELDGAKAMEEVNSTGAVTIVLNGNEEKIDKEDMVIETEKMEGFVTGEDHGITVVIDTNLTDELIEEGYVREVISKVQTMRKEAGFEVMDHINLYLNGNDKIAAIAEKNADMIKRIVLAESIITGSVDGIDTANGAVKDWNLNGEDVTIGVKKL
ncbi:MAG: class I tRNA ligase family protein, partial [Lachnospiraceae bacterium]|nr:class I tRNA ligase family protein [Lachnospiraceae bacterium]